MGNDVKAQLSGATKADNPTASGFANVATLVCRHVMQRERPVRYMLNAGTHIQANCDENDHDYDKDPSRDGDLSFVCFAHILARDSSLDVIASLPVDWAAARSSTSEEWRTFFDPE